MHMSTPMRKPRNLEAVTAFPSPKYPFYHIKASFFVDRKLEYEIGEVRVNGDRVRDYTTSHNGIHLKDRHIQGGGLSEVVIRSDWRCGEDLKIGLKGRSKKNKDSLSFSMRTTASSYGGYWDPSWKHYAGIVLSETAGVSRANEPVHVTLALYSDRVGNPEKEVRVVAVDPETGVQTEIPSQVYATSRYRCKTQTERYQSTTALDVCFYADVPADSERVYLAFYGNPDARLPDYKGRLKVSGRGLGLTLENPFYKTVLHEKSGSIDEIHMKMGADRVFAHHLETNGALHWNPGLYAPPRPWIHTSDWDPPKNYTKTGGPLFFTTARSGPLDLYPESHISINYRFYDRVPWIVMSSTIRITKELSVKALRNGEIVLNRELVEEFAWRGPDGTVDSMIITDGPRHPEHAKVLPYDTPWVCLFNRKHECGLGLLTLEVSNFNEDGGLCKLYNPYSYLQWGPWVYFARPLVYTFVSNNPGRLIPVPAGNVYYEQMAFLPVRFSMEEEHIEYIDRLYTSLSNPLYSAVFEDTDPRAPEGWMPPILVEEFEEMEDE